MFINSIICAIIVCRGGGVLSGRDTSFYFNTSQFFLEKSLCCLRLFSASVYVLDGGGCVMFISSILFIVVLICSHTHLSFL